MQKDPHLMLAPRFAPIVDRISSIVLGKDREIRLALACLFGKGHLLIEDIPGIGKTTLAKVLAQTLGLEFTRVQCTSDMLPSDILGASIYDQSTGKFTLHKGPVFTQVLLADEINRTTPKTQSALLEAMEERQVSIEGHTYPLGNPFFVIATQNPFEQGGTFILPESQLDRFLMRIHIGYPSRSAERDILKSSGQSRHHITAHAVLSASDVAKIQDEIAAVNLADTLLEYVQDILQFSRDSNRFALGLSPRAGIALIRAAQAWAFIHGRNHVLPEDVQQVFPYVAAHRLVSAEHTSLEHAVLQRVFEEVAVPR